jgi:AraC-like DNA-binding protein
VMSYIADASGDVKMTETAAMVGMSESAFSRYFARTAGQSFSETVRKMRMAQARQLLEHTDRPIASIASKIGYQNLSNFNRQFRQLHRLTPTQFRRQKSSS